jgi:hypothetical protein
MCESGVEFAFNPRESRRIRGFAIRDVWRPVTGDRVPFNPKDVAPGSHDHARPAGNTHHGRFFDLAGVR